MTVTITTTCSGLRALLAPPALFADRDNSVPILAAVRVQGHGKWVTATATDRVSLGVQRALLSAPKRLDALVPIGAVESMLRIFKTYRSNNPDVTLRFTDTSVTVSGPSANPNGPDNMSVTYMLVQGEYPKLGDVWCEGRLADIGQVAISPHLVWRIERAAVENGNPYVRMGAIAGDGDGLRPVLFEVGNDFRALVMPMRTVAGSQPMLSSEWLALLADRPAPKAATKKSAS